MADCEHTFIIRSRLYGIALDAYRFKQLAVAPDFNFFARDFAEFEALPMGCVYCAVESQCLLGRVDAEMHKCFREGYFLRLMKIEERIIQVKEHISYHHKPPQIFRLL